ncbi:MAG: hypothetical protein Q9157_003120 [Trypethelium eluteriae]
MLLTLSAPAKTEFDFKPPHDYSPPLSNSVARPSPKANSGSLPPLPVSASSTMSTPHRGLPPPAAMTLPDPSRGQAPLSQSFNQMPAPPSQWQGAEEPMRNWLLAKAEEDKRKQEEEKTKQETIKLDQRKIEQSMLRESLSGGIPQHLIPLIFAGIGGGNLTNASLELLQHYMVQLQAQQQQPSQQPIPGAQASPDVRRETRMINPGQTSAYNVGPQPAQQSLPAGPVLPGQPLAQAAPGYSLGGASPSNRARASSLASAPTSAPRPPAHAALPRLTTNEMQIHQPPPNSQGVHQLHQNAPSGPQEAAASSPSIYFHHWVPPTSQAEKSLEKQPSTPSEYTHSPKKRKAQGAHPAAPAPSTAQHQGTSPSFSQISSSTSTTTTPGKRSQHARNRSDVSVRGPELQTRPTSRRSGGHFHEFAAEEAQPSQFSEERSERRHSAQRETGLLQQSRYSSGSRHGSEHSSPKREEPSSRSVP